MISLGLAVSVAVGLFAARTYLAQRDQFTTLRHVEGSGRALLLIHGWTGTASTWPEVTKRLLRDDRFMGLSVYEATYTTPVLTEGKSTGEIAFDISSSLRQLGKVKQVAILAHSMGGIVGRKLVLDAQSNDPKYEALITLGSPFAGADAATVGGHLSLSPSYLAELRTNSPQLRELSLRWEQKRQSKDMLHFIEVCFYGDQDKLVTAASATSQCASQHRLASLTHQTLPGGEGFSDHHYAAITAPLAKFMTMQ